MAKRGSARVRAGGLRGIYLVLAAWATVSVATAVLTGLKALTAFIVMQAALPVVVVSVAEGVAQVLGLAFQLGVLWYVLGLVEQEATEPSWLVPVVLAVVGMVAQPVTIGMSAATSVMVGRIGLEALGHFSMATNAIGVVAGILRPMIWIAGLLIAFARWRSAWLEGAEPDAAASADAS